MPTNLDSILNVLIPAGIFIAILLFIYFKAKKPIDNFFSSIKDKLSGDKEGSNDGTQADYVKTGDYKIDYRGPNY